MKIVVMTNGLYPEQVGGVEKLAADLTRRLAARNDVTVYTSSRPGQPMSETRDGYTVRRFKTADDYPLGLAKGTRALSMVRALRHESPRPDVILSMSLQFGTTALAARACFGIPFVLYALGTDWPLARDGGMKGMGMRLGLQRCNAAVAQTGIIREEMQSRFGDTRIEVIGNGIEIPTARATGGSIVFLGRLAKVKGIEYLIEAARTANNWPEVVIAGGGPEEARLRELAEGLNVRFAGRVENVEDVFLSGRVFVLPSLSEGLPQAMLEAMSYGLPVVATNVGGNAEVVDHGENGFLVEPRDAAALGAHVSKILDDDAMHRRFSERALETVRAYAWENVERRFEDLFVDVVSSSRYNTR